MKKSIFKIAAIAAIVLFTFSACDKDKSIAFTTWECKDGLDRYYVTFYEDYVFYRVSEWGTTDYDWEANLEYTYVKPNVTIYLPSEILTGNINGSKMVLKTSDGYLLIFEKTFDYR